MRRSTVVLLAAALLSATLGTAAHAGAKPVKCPKPPLEIRVQPGPAGGDTRSDLAVTDAVARRVPIVPQPSGTTTRDPKALERLRDRAADTPLALYTLYLADFPVRRAELRGFGFGEVEAPPGKTVAAVTIVPTRNGGFEAGDVAKAGPFEYESTTTFAPVSLVVNTSGTRATYAYDAVEGAVRIRELGPKSICLDLDLAFSRGGQVVASATGTARAPVVRAAPSFFYT